MAVDRPQQALLGQLHAQIMDAGYDGLEIAAVHMSLRTWDVLDASPAVGFPANPRVFGYPVYINDYPDGLFFLSFTRWPGDARKDYAAYGFPNLSAIVSGGPTPGLFTEPRALSIGFHTRKGD